MVINKKAAMELSMSTIVVLVLAMSMLILGLVLVKTIFTGAKYNVDTVNTKVQNEINKLFVEDEKMVVYLSNYELEIKQGEDWGVAFALKNLIEGVATSSRFDYTIRLDSPNEVKDNCGGLSEQQALSWIKAGKSGSITLNPGKSDTKIIRMSLPEVAPLCIVRYTIDVEDPEGRGIYVSRSFDLNIQG